MLGWSLAKQDQLCKTNTNISMPGTAYAMQKCYTSWEAACCNAKYDLSQTRATKFYQQAIYDNFHGKTSFMVPPASVTSGLHAGYAVQIMPLSTSGAARICRPWHVARPGHIAIMGFLAE